MKSKIMKFLKIFLLISILVVVVLAVIGVTLVLRWPWWVGLFLLLFFLVLGAGIFFLWHFRHHRDSNKLTQESAPQTEDHIATPGSKEGAVQQELQDSWKNAVNTLRSSHLKKLGNPLHVLPWYVIIGESGSGKTTSLQSARLASALTDDKVKEGVSGTRNCEWWYLEKAVVIDTAGRYSLLIDDEADRKEWRKFLSLLLNYRKRKALNGLIVTVAADKLIQSGAELIEKEGVAIRRRIDELMQVLGVRFPVYVMVTKCDYIHGMNRFCNYLPEACLKQPMGVINQSLTEDPADFLKGAMASIGERLRYLRLLLLNQPEAKQADPAVLLFPEDFKAVERGLEVFMKAAFSKSTYQETPLLRGLYFGSGRQKGQSYSPVSESLGMHGEGETLPDTSRGLFLHDFYEKILPGDRYLMSPTRRAIQWRSLVGNVGLIAWGVLLVAMCGFLSYSFVKNMSTIRGISDEFPKLPALRGHYLTDMAQMDKFRRGILRVEDQNKHWWVPRFGLNESIDVEHVLKERYCGQLRHGFMDPFDRKLVHTVRAVSSSSDDQYGQYVVHIVRRINILKTRLEQGNLEVMQKKPQPSYILMDGEKQHPDQERRKIFGDLYLHYILWRSDPDDIRRELSTLQATLKQIVDSRAGDLRWMTAWIDRQGSVPPVTLSEFWGGGQAVSGELQVAPAFTARGKQAMDAFVGELEEALSDASLVARKKGEFDAVYRTRCFEAWRAFAADFARGASRLGGYEQPLLAGRMAADGGPYFMLMGRMASELEQLRGGGSVPGWLAQIYQFQAAMAQGYLQNKGAVEKVAESGRKILGAVTQATGQDAGSRRLEMQMMAGQALGNYRNCLSLIAPAAASKNQAYLFAAQVFNEEPATSKSPFYVGYAAITRLRTGIAADAVPDEVVGRLISGPLDFLWRFVFTETVGYLEGVWNEQVLAGVPAGMTKEQAMPLLLAQDGPVSKFIQGPAAPFVKRCPQRGYCAKTALGSTFPIDAANAKYALLEKQDKAAAAFATKRPSYNVSIKALPTEANPGVKIQPHETRLSLECGVNAQTIVNRNYPVNKTFNWSSDGCSDVILKIDIGDAVLEKRYSGPYAFVDFLKEFHGGSRSYALREFPGETEHLEKMGIRYVKVNYHFIGHESVIQNIDAIRGNR